MNNSEAKASQSSAADRLEEKLLLLFQRLNNCAISHQGDDAEWIDGTCTSPILATKEAIKLFTTELAAVRDELLNLTESEYQKLSTIGRVGDDGYTKIYIPASYRQTIRASINQVFERHGVK